MKSKASFKTSEANEIVRLIKEKLKAEPTKQRGIREQIRKIGFYASDYGFRDGYTVEQILSVANIVESQPFEITTESLNTPSVIVNQPASSNKTRSRSDECYVIDLCDEVLNQTALRQHRFDFLKGDSGKKLPVDAYYPDMQLVVEFREKQHTEKVNFFDRRQTVSGVGRGEQRKLYDQRRRDTLPQQGIQLVEIGYDDLKHNKRKKLLRNRADDLKVISDLLKGYLPKNNPAKP